MYIEKQIGEKLSCQCPGMIVGLIQRYSWHWDVNQYIELLDWLFQNKVNKQVQYMTMFHCLLYFPQLKFKTLPKDRRYYFFENHDFLLDLTRQKLILDYIIKHKCTIEAVDTNFGRLYNVWVDNCIRGETRNEIQGHCAEWYRRIQHLNKQITSNTKYGQIFKYCTQSIHQIVLKSYIKQNKGNVYWKSLRNINYEVRSIMMLCTSIPRNMF